MRKDPVGRLERRCLEAFAEEWQRWMKETLADILDPSVMANFMKTLGVDPLGPGGTVPGQSGFDAYRILGLDSSASDEQVKKRYHDLLHRLHPDTSGTPATGFLFEMVVAAFETIKRERGWT